MCGHVLLLKVFVFQSGFMMYDVRLWVSESRQWGRSDFSCPAVLPDAAGFLLRCQPLATLFPFSFFLFLPTPKIDLLFFQEWLLMWDDGFPCELIRDAWESHMSWATCAACHVASASGFQAPVSCCITAICLTSPSKKRRAYKWHDDSKVGFGLVLKKSRCFPTCHAMPSLFIFPFSAVCVGRKRARTQRWWMWGEDRGGGGQIAVRVFLPAREFEECQNAKALKPEARWDVPEAITCLSLTTSHTHPSSTHALHHWVVCLFVIIYILHIINAWLETLTVAWRHHIGSSGRRDIITIRKFFLLSITHTPRHYSRALLGYFSFIRGEHFHHYIFIISPSRLLSRRRLLHARRRLRHCHWPPVWFSFSITTHTSRQLFAIIFMPFDDRELLPAQNMVCLAMLKEEKDMRWQRQERWHGWWWLIYLSLLSLFLSLSPLSCWQRQMTGETEKSSCCWIHGHMHEARPELSLSLSLSFQRLLGFPPSSFPS